MVEYKYKKDVLKETVITIELLKELLGVSTNRVIEIAYKEVYVKGIDIKVKGEVAEGKYTSIEVPYELWSKLEGVNVDKLINDYGIQEVNKAGCYKELKVYAKAKEVHKGLMYLKLSEEKDTSKADKDSMWLAGVISQLPNKENKVEVRTLHDIRAIPKKAKRVRLGL